MPNAKASTLIAPFDRRALLGGSCAALAASSLGATPVRPTAGFVSRQGVGFVRDGAPYLIVGANMWYAAWLGADAAFGDRARLDRELDRLEALGVNNLRIMASAEEGPLKNAITPGFTRPDGSPNEVLLAGLDYALAQIASRRMTAVLVLSNFWEWSGGLQTLLWRHNGRYIDAGDPEHPWPEYGDATAQFYADLGARALFAMHVELVIQRTSTITGRRYADEPSIFAWQLANEPRPGGSDAAIARNADAYCDWIFAAAAQIRQLAPQHLVSLGHEGSQGTNGDVALVARAHDAIDYMTAHIWPLNWGWANGSNLAGSWATTTERTADYIAAHAMLAERLGKPLVIEEFGFPRDGELYAPKVGTHWRERFYAQIYTAVAQSWQRGGPIAGSAFWAWNGEGRALHPDHRFRTGDRAYLGDPPHEPQGWYGNYNTDHGVLALIRGQAALRDQRVRAR